MRVILFIGIVKILTSLELFEGILGQKREQVIEKEPESLFNHSESEESYRKQIGPTIKQKETILKYYFPFITFDEKNNLRILRPTQNIDKIERLFGNNYVSNILQLPLKGSGIKPWSGHYWAARYGYISVRYTRDEKDTQYYSEKRGIYLYNYLTYTYTQSVLKYSQPAEHIKYNKTDNYSDYVNAYYSPSEKYDLLIGDESFTLTNLMKQEGKRLIHGNGDVNSWSGICHGWAVAAYWETRPLRPVWVRAADKKTIIQFLPDDIKALISQYWAYVSFDNHMLGNNKCQVYDFSTLPSDPSTGLTLDYNCFGINPGSFHLAITNQMGVRGNNFVFEPKADFEVWNHPVWKYNSTYYNPISLEEGGAMKSIVTIEEAKKNLTNFLNFVIKNKAPNSVFLIGIKTTIYYISEIEPDRKNFTIPDSEKDKTYSYVLELDVNKKIIQGEWTTNDHPNWIFTPTEDANTDIDKEIPLWLGSPDYLISVKDSIMKQSRNKLPLKAIVRYLLKRSVQ